MPPARGGRSTQRRTTPQSPAKPASSITSPRKTRHNPRSVSFEPEPLPRTQLPELDAVIEEAELAGRGTSAVGASSVASADTQGEFHSLKAGEILENLPDFFEDTVKLIKVFTSNKDGIEKILTDLTDPSSPFSRRCSRMQGRWLDLRSSFGSAVFITPEIVARKFPAFLNNTADVSWRPDGIMYLANIAFFLGAMFTGSEENKDESFQKVYPRHPDYFMSTDLLSPFATAFVGQTIEFGLRLRTQYFIMLIERAFQNGDDVEPHEYLRELFQTESSTFRDLIIAGDAQAEYEAAIKDRIEAIGGFLTTDPTEPVNLDALKTAYPFSSFLEELLRWSDTRRQELEAVIEDQGGAEGIVATLTSQYPDMEITLSQPQASGSVQPAPAPRSSGQLRQNWTANFNRLRDINMQNAAQSTGMEVESQSKSVDGSTRALAVPNDESQPLDIDDQNFANALSAEIHRQNGDPSVDQQMDQVLAELAMQKANEQAMLANKQRSFIDRQPNAVRVNFDDTQPPTSRTRKRAAEEDDEDDFENDSRPQKRRVNNDNIDPQLRPEPDLPPFPEDIIPSQPSLPPPTPQRKQRAPRKPQNKSVPSSSAPAPAQAPNSPSSDNLLPSSAPDALDSDSPNTAFLASQQYRTAAELAKKKGRDHKSGKSLAPFIDPDQQTQLPLVQEAILSSGMQKRAEWTPAEEDRLIRLIATVGASYSRILQADRSTEDPQLQRRSQVQLKDKARNMKFAFMRSGTKLPTGFAPVTLGKRMVAQLVEMGVVLDVST